MSSQSKIANNQIHKLTCKVRALGEDMYDVKRTSVSYMYDVNRYNMVIDHSDYENRKNTLTPFLKKLVSDYQKDGYKVIKNVSDTERSLYHLEAQFEDKWIYISLEYYNVKDYPTQINWNVSISDKQNDYWSK